MGFLITLILNALALLVAAHFVPGFRIPSFATALVAAIVLGLLNALVKPILILLTLPLNILTLGLFTFVINAFVLWLAALLVPGFAIDRFFPTALLAAIVLAVVNMVLSLLVWR